MKGVVAAAGAGTALSKSCEEWKSIRRGRVYSPYCRSVIGRTGTFDLSHCHRLRLLLIVTSPSIVFTPVTPPSSLSHHPPPPPSCSIALQPSSPTAARRPSCLCPLVPSTVIGRVLVR
jgi:hypothetical protein